MPEAHENLLNYISGQQVEFELFDHEPAGSVEEYHRVLKTNYAEQAKALLLRYKKTGEKGYVVLTLQANKRADLDRVQRILQAKSLRLARISELQRITGCNYGELPPFGKPFGVQLIMDRDLLDQKQILFNAAKLDRSIRIDPKIVRQIEEPILY